MAAVLHNPSSVTMTEGESITRSGGRSVNEFIDSFGSSSAVCESTKWTSLSPVKAEMSTGTANMTILLKNAKIWK